VKNEIKKKGIKSHWWRSKHNAFTFIQDKGYGTTKSPEGNASFFMDWFWKDGQEAAAHAYELARRYGNVILPKFTELEIEERKFLRSVFPRSENTWPFVESPDRIKFKPGHSWPSVWRLELPNNALFESFKYFIKEQRVIHGIKAGRNRSSKGPSWAQVEILDGVSYAGGNDPERLRRKAASMAKANHKLIVSALAKHPSPLPNLTRLLSK
jgi:hypothetical protein